MPISEFDPGTGALPPGEHLASMEDIYARFGTNFKRREIYDGLNQVVRLLLAKSVSVIWVDGSYITTKLRPRDVDVVYRPPLGADVDKWDLLAPGRRPYLKRYYLVDLWPYPSPQPVPRSNRRITIKQFFEQDNGVPKGIIRVDLGSGS